MTKNKESIINRILSFILIFALTISMVGNIIEYSYSTTAYNTLGTNKALGSPILNQNFSADDWNRWEIIAWGIFLSNFAQPFVDDYNSAFNLNSGKGSNGSGVQALKFGSGNDPSNTLALQELLDFAVNQQMQGSMRPIYVSYTTMENGLFTEKSQFTTSVGSMEIFGKGLLTNQTPSTTPAPSGSPAPSASPAPSQGIAGENNTPGVGTIRQANASDLVFNAIGSGLSALFSDTPDPNTTWIGSTTSGLVNTVVMKTINYVDITGTLNGSFPTFAIRTNSNTYETVLDYTDAYDLSIVSGALTRGVSSNKDIREKFSNNLSSIISNPDNFKLYLDTFGNICTPIDGSYVVLIPASANKYLTATPSINLVNSLVFNSSVSTAGQEDLVLHAGQGTTLNFDSMLNLVAASASGNVSATVSALFDVMDGYIDWSGGGNAISNGAKGVPAGSPILYFDTDTIVMQKALESGHQLGINSNYLVNIGEIYTELFDLDIAASGQKYAFKIEPANIMNLDWSGVNDNAVAATAGTVLAASQLTNIFSTSPNIDVTSTLKTDTGDLNIFGDAVVVPVQLEDATDVSFIGGGVSLGKAKMNNRAIFRRFVNWVYQASRQDYATTSGTVQRQSVMNALKNSTTVSDMYKNLLMESDGSLTPLFKSFVVRRTDLYKDIQTIDINKASYDSGNGIGNFLGGIVGDTSGPEAMLLGGHVDNKSIKLKDTIEPTWTSGNPNKLPQNRSPFSRSIKVYATSEVMRSVANVLGVREGTDFAVFSTYIYLTYLDWYGVTKTVKTGSINSSDASKNDSANFNTRIFDTTSDILNVDINSIVSTVSEEEKEKQILDWTYTLLNPTDGRAYRSQMIVSAFSDFVYDNYQKIVYGNATSYYDTGTGVTSRNSTGFLALQPYSENFVTAWFVSNYSFFASILIGVFTILTIIMGLLRKRKISWYFISIIVMLNMILVLPSTGEVAPLVANNAVQDMFSDKMTYWSISEQVQNAKMEADYVTSNTISNGFLNSLSKQEQKQVVNLVKNLNVLYTDRSLMVKQDISKKVSGVSNSTYEDVQQLRSVRWMLPMIMREFTESADNANYVYVPMSDKLEDLSNMYWYFNPTAAAYAETVNSQQTGVPTYDSNDIDKTYHEQSVRGDFYTEYEIHTEGYNNDENDTSSIPYKQKSYSAEFTGHNTHTYSYLLPFSALGGSGGEIIEYTKDTSYDDWAKSIVRYAKSNFETLGTSGTSSEFDAYIHAIEGVMGEYNRFDRGTISIYYGYLWATENPLHFFYQGIAESFEQSATYGAMVGQIYGQYSVPDGKEEEVHKTFMHAGESGYLRDILDFEEMFKNMIPYLYAMQLGAEGYKDEPGYFSEDDMIEGYPKHEFLNKSWIFRSNWVTKIMENKDFNTVGHIRDKDGNSYEVANMLLPSCYPEDRPMIFSEAQMKQYGLDEADLSLIELKCLAVNKEVYKQWTLLVNYASVKGLTREVMLREMALTALFAFNKEFSPVGVTGAAYQMYPVGLDLRSISFDSVMKMLMLNVTHDTAFIYGDTMQTIVEDADIGTALVLLVTAWICATFIPLVRNVLMGAIFFLGLWSIVWSIMKDTKTKAKVSCGYFVSNVVFLGMTFIYYSIIKTLVAMTTTDQVLTISQVEINTGNPIWCLIVMLVISCLYVFFMYKFGCMLFKSYRDMGFEIYAGISSIAVGNINKGIERLGSSISSSYGVGEHSYKSSKTQGRKKKEPVDVKNVDPDRDMNNNSGGSSKSGKSSKVKDEDKARLDTPDGGDYDKSGYTDGRYKDTDTTGSRDIDKQISKGREIDRKEREAEHKNNKTDQEKSKYKNN